MAEPAGVWRTVMGRRIFIASGDGLSAAMKSSGKFKKYKLASKKASSRINTLTKPSDKEAAKAYESAIGKINADKSGFKVTVKNVSRPKQKIQDTPTLGKKVRATPKEDKVPTAKATAYEKRNLMSTGDRQGVTEAERISEWQKMNPGGDIRSKEVVMYMLGVKQPKIKAKRKK